MSDFKALFVEPEKCTKDFNNFIKPEDCVLDLDIIKKVHEETLEKCDWFYRDNWNEFDGWYRGNVNDLVKQGGAFYHVTTKFSGWDNKFLDKAVEHKDLIYYDEAAQDALKLTKEYLKLTTKFANLSIKYLDELIEQQGLEYHDGTTDYGNWYEKKLNEWIKQTGCAYYGDVTKFAGRDDQFPNEVIEQKDQVYLDKLIKFHDKVKWMTGRLFDEIIAENITKEISKDLLALPCRLFIDDPADGHDVQVVKRVHLLLHLLDCAEGLGVADQYLNAKAIELPCKAEASFGTVPVIPNIPFVY